MNVPNVFQAHIEGVAVNSSGVFVAVGYKYLSFNDPMYATSNDGSTWTTLARMNGSTNEGEMRAITVNRSNLFVSVGAGYASLPNPSGYSNTPVSAYAIFP